MLIDYGCGAHSDTPVPPGGQGSPAYDAYDDGAVEVVARQTAVREAVSETVPAEPAQTEPVPAESTLAAAEAPVETTEPAADPATETAVDSVVEAGAVAATVAVVESVSGDSVSEMVADGAAVVDAG